MNFNKWTLALAAAGVVSLGSVAQAEEAQNHVLTALSSTTLSGYVSTSAIWKFGAGNGPFKLAEYNGLAGAGTFGGGKYDGFNLDVVKLSLAKPLDEGNWSAGFAFDLLFGPDARVYGNSDAAVQNAYVLLRAPVGTGLDIKMGLFEALVGYEPYDYTKNSHWSRSYGYSIEPLQHTGVTLAYQFTEWLRVEGGIANTWDSTLINSRSTFIDFRESETEKSYLGLITLTAPESWGSLKGSTLCLGAVDGIDNTSGGYYVHTTSLYADVTVNTPMEGLKVGAAFDYRDAETFDKDNANAYAFAGYIVYKASEKLTLADRFEYANFDSYGVPFLDEELVIPDFDVIANTFTVDYKLWDNVITRAEFRWDHALDDDARIFGSFDQDSLWLGLNVIYQF
jgi:hypothetical protein